MDDVKSFKAFDGPVSKKLDGCSWLLTGATGFLGSVLIAQLLRTCNPSKVVLIILPKAGEPPMVQVEKLLARPLYNLMREKYGGMAKLLQRFEAIEQDLSVEEELHFPEVDIVVHAAASIAFNNHIHEAINANFKATQAMAACAAKMPKLKSFVHVSTCYVNGNLPRGTRVPEKILPMEHLGQPEEYQMLVDELMGLPWDDAEQKAVGYRKLWNFPNNYALTKRLAEHLVLDRYKEGLPLKIVRPSIIGGTSLHHVMPGYIGNAGGSTAFALGVAFGMWAFTEFKPDHTTALIPADFVSSGIILAAAANMDKAADGPLILQCATSGTESTMTNQMFHDAVARKERQHPVAFKVFPGYPKQSMTEICGKTPKEHQVCLHRANNRVRLRCWGLRLTGQKPVANAISTLWRVFKIVSGSEMDFNLLFSCDNVVRLWEELSPEEQKLFLCVWRKGVDDWDEYLDAYMSAVWDRYVSRAGGGHGASRKRSALAVTVSAASVVGLAYLWYVYMSQV